MHNMGIPLLETKLHGIPYFVTWMQTRNESWSASRRLIAAIGHTSESAREKDGITLPFCTYVYREMNRTSRSKSQQYTERTKHGDSCEYLLYIMQ